MKATPKEVNRSICLTCAKEKNLREVLGFIEAKKHSQDNVSHHVLMTPDLEEEKGEIE